MQKSHLLPARLSNSSSVTHIGDGGIPEGNTLGGYKGILQLTITDFRTFLRGGTEFKGSMLWIFFHVSCAAHPILENFPFDSFVCWLISAAKQFPYPFIMNLIETLKSTLRNRFLFHGEIFPHVFESFSIIYKYFFN